MFPSLLQSIHCLKTWNLCRVFIHFWHSFTSVLLGSEACFGCVQEMQDAAHRSRLHPPHVDSLHGNHTVRQPEYTLYQPTASRKTHYPATTEKEGSRLWIFLTLFFLHVLGNTLHFRGTYFVRAVSVAHLTRVGWSCWRCGWRGGRVRGCGWGGGGGCVWQLAVVWVEHTLLGEGDVVQRHEPSDTIPSLIPEDKLRRTRKIWALTSPPLCATPLTNAL